VGSTEAAGAASGGGPDAATGTAFVVAPARVDLGAPVVFDGDKGGAPVVFDGDKGGAPVVFDGDKGGAIGWGARPAPIAPALAVATEAAAVVGALVLVALALAALATAGAEGLDDTVGTGAPAGASSEPAARTSEDADCRAA
jgi:hypothetical protein